MAAHWDREAQDRHPAAALSLTSLEVDVSLVSLSPGRKLGLDDCRWGRGGAYGDLPSDLSRICIPPPAISFAHLENTSDTVTPIGQETQRTVPSLSDMGPQAMSHTGFGAYSAAPPWHGR